MSRVMSRGDRREDIFLDDVGRHDFIKKLAESCQEISVSPPIFLGAESFIVKSGAVRG
jgi:hypothetical protein